MIKNFVYLSVFIFSLMLINSCDVQDPQLSYGCGDCSEWVDDGCGSGECQEWEMRQTRDCEGIYGPGQKIIDVQNPPPGGPLNSPPHVPAYCLEQCVPTADCFPQDREVCDVYSGLCQEEGDESPDEYKLICEGIDLCSDVGFEFCYVPLGICEHPSLPPNCYCIFDEPTYMDCVEESCVEVVGEGASVCAIDLDCEPQEDTCTDGTSPGECSEVFIGLYCDEDLELIESCFTHDCGCPVGEECDEQTELCSVPIVYYNKCVAEMCEDVVCPQGETCDDECEINDDCGPIETHLECNIYDQCVEISGAGADECAIDSDCKHNECVGLSCESVSGPGEDLCQTNDNCDGVHFECVGASCEAVDGEGMDICFSTEDCIGPDEICDNGVDDDGDGLVDCDDSLECIQCGPNCVNIMNNEDNCGGCNLVCTAGNECIDGYCECSGDDDCSYGQVCDVLTGMCEDEEILDCYESCSPVECEGRSCGPNGEICVDGVCDEGNPSEEDVCGNFIVEEGEECDTVFYLGEAGSCEGLGEPYYDGFLSCYPAGHSEECTYNVDGCSQGRYGFDLSGSTYSQEWTVIVDDFSGEIIDDMVLEANMAGGAFRGGIRLLCGDEIIKTYEIDNPGEYTLFDGDPKNIWGEDFICDDYKIEAFSNPSGSGTTIAVDWTGHFLINEIGPEVNSEFKNTGAFVIYEGSGSDWRIPQGLDGDLYVEGPLFARSYDFYVDEVSPAGSSIEWRFVCDGEVVGSGSVAHDLNEEGLSFGEESLICWEGFYVEIKPDFWPNDYIGVDDIGINLYGHEPVCEFAEIYVDKIVASDGDGINTFVRGFDDCRNKWIKLEVWEADIGEDDFVADIGASKFNDALSPTVYEGWNVEWQCDNYLFDVCIDYWPEYYVKAIVIDEPASYLESMEIDISYP